MASYWDEYTGGLAKVQKEFDTGDRGLFDYVLGTAAYGLGKPAADLVGIPIGYAMDQVPESVKQGAIETAKELGVPEAMQYVGQKIDEYIPEDTQRRISEATMFAEALPMFRAAGILRDPAARGMFTSSGEVYKKGNYRPDDVELNYAEKAVGATLGDPIRYVSNKTGLGTKVEGITGKTPEQLLNNAEAIYKKAKGTLEWGANGIGRVANLMFNPNARALYTERGISPVFNTYYKMYQQAEAAGDKVAANQALELAQTQMQQMANIKKQAGQVTRGDDATTDFINAAADPAVDTAFFNAGEVGQGWFHKTASQSDSVIRGIDKADSDFIEDHVMKAWGVKDPAKTEIIVKTPRSDYTGNHFNDVLARNTNVSRVAELFADKDGNFVPFESGQALADQIERLNSKATTYQRARDGKKVGDVKRDPNTGKPESKLFNIKKVDEDGVWLTMSKPGTAKVEGGVNMLIRVDNNGNLTGVMSDLHDFYEKLPTGKLASKLGIKGVPDVPNVPLMMALPKNVIAVSPPMQTNVVSITGKTFNDKTQKAMGMKQADTTPTPEAAKKAAVRERVEATAQIKPSTGEVVRESIPVAQNAALVGGGVASNIDENPFAYDPELFGTPF